MKMLYAKLARAHACILLYYYNTKDGSNNYRLLKLDLFPAKGLSVCVSLSCGLGVSPSC